MKLKEALVEAKPGHLNDLELGRILRKAQKNPKWGEAFIHQILLSANYQTKDFIKDAAQEADQMEKRIPSYYAKGAKD